MNEKTKTKEIERNICNKNTKISDFNGRIYE